MRFGSSSPMSTFARSQIERCRKRPELSAARRTRPSLSPLEILRCGITFRFHHVQHFHSIDRLVEQSALPSARRDLVPAPRPGLSARREARSGRLEITNNRGRGEPHGSRADNRTLARSHHEVREEIAQRRKQVSGIAQIPQARPQRSLG